MIEAAHLTKRFGAKTAVDDLSFTVIPGVVTGFLGPNGAWQAGYRIVTLLRFAQFGPVSNVSPVTNRGFSVAHVACGGPCMVAGSGGTQRLGGR